MSDKLTGTDFFESLTGFDEIAIAQRFGHTVTDLASSQATMFTRALVFVAQRRDGATDDDAYNAAMNMPMKDVSTFFAQNEEEEAGKALEVEPEPEPEPQPATSLSSVS